MTKALSIDDNFRGQWVDGDILTISYEYSEVTVNIMEGKGKVTRFRATPLIAQMVKLHKETSKWWIYFSDSFGAGILVMAVTGMFIEKGKFSFRSRGWKLAIAGIIFPLLFLFFSLKTYRGMPLALYQKDIFHCNEVGDKRVLNVSNMLENYLKIALRSLLQNKMYAFINVSGLALGLAASIVIFLIVRNELSYDRHHKKANRTYRVTVHGLDFNPRIDFQWRRRNSSLLK